MAKRLEVYKCEICGNIVEVLHGGKGQLVCCGQPMVNMTEQTAEMATEKHVPVLTRDGDNIKVVVGSTIHPMMEKHFIEWIEIINDSGKVYRKFLKPGDDPEAVFLMCENCAGGLYAREYCNIHGLWRR